MSGIIGGTYRGWRDRSGVIGIENSGVTDTGWTTMTLLNSWVHYDTNNFGPVRYRKVGYVVEVMGIMKSGSSTIFAVLPAGYRPSQRTRGGITSGATVAGQDDYWEIASNGTCSLNSNYSNDWCGASYVFTVS